MSAPEIFVTIMRWMARAVDGGTHAAKLAGLIVAQRLLELVGSEAIHDVRLIKNSLLERTQAETANRVATAARNANKVRDELHQAAIREQKRRAAELANAKSEAEVDEIRAATVRNDRQQKSDAEIGFIKAVSELVQKGGCVMVDSENLKDILSDFRSGEEAREDVRRGVVKLASAVSQQFKEKGDGEWSAEFPTSVGWYWSRNPDGRQRLYEIVDAPHWSDRVEDGESVRPECKGLALRFAQSDPREDYLLNGIPFDEWTWRGPVDPPT